MLSEFGSASFDATEAKPDNADGECLIINIGCFLHET